MNYSKICKAKFIKRPNRFIAHVHLNGQEEIVHVKNTGRCREILREGTTVILEKASNKNRKTAYSLIAAYKNELLINIDSQVPNQVIFEALEEGDIKGLENLIEIKREVSYANSRFDIYFEDINRKGFIEVKGVTLEDRGSTMFPDAPTVRGSKHLNEMIKAVKEGYAGYIIFLIQLKGAEEFTPNYKTDPEFAKNLKLAEESGVKLLAYDCLVTEDSITLNKEVPIIPAELQD